MDLNVALAYLNSAISSMNSAMAIHTCIDDKLREFEDIYHTFIIFSDEFLDNCETEHSHQSTSDDFSQFEKEYKHSIVPDYPV